MDFQKIRTDDGALVIRDGNITWVDRWLPELVMDQRGIEDAKNPPVEELDEPEFIERATEVVDSNWFYNNDYYNHMYQDVGGEA